MLLSGGKLQEDQILRFNFPKFEKEFESFYGKILNISYYLKVIV